MNLPETKRTDVSANELQLRKLDRRDIMMRILQNIFLFIVVGLTLLNLFQLQEVIAQNQRSSEARSNVAAKERQELKDYIKCVLLIRYDVPDATTLTREQASKTLDDCAMSTGSGR